jgi:molybdopterin-binding protein
MTLSARNHLTGTVEEIQLGDVLAHVTVKVAGGVIESVITRRSAEEMGLKKGDSGAAALDLYRRTGKNPRRRIRR